MMRFLGLVLGLSLFAPFAHADAAKKAAAHQEDLAPDIALADLKRVVAEKKATIIDANGKDMYAQGHIPGAISFAANEAKLASVLPANKDALIIAYCGGPRCSAWQEPAKTAKSLGYTNIKHFRGGISGWKEAGLATEASKI